MTELRLYLKFLAIAFRSRLQYRSDFLIGVAGVSVLNSSILTLIWVWIRNFRSLGGWQYWEIAMLYSMYLLSHSVYAAFFWHLSRLEDDILQGRFGPVFAPPMQSAGTIPWSRGQLHGCGR